MFDPTIYLNQANAKSICCGCDDDDKQKLSVTPPLMYYSYIPVGEESEAQPLVITNVGSEAVAVQSIEVTEDFWIVNKNALPINLTPGNSVTLNIMFKPKNPGVRHSVVRIKAGVKPAQDCVLAVGIGGKHEFVADLIQMQETINNQNQIIQQLNAIYTSDLRWVYDISLSAYDLFALNMVIGPVPLLRDCYFPANAEESQTAGLPPTLGDHIFAILQNNTEIGYLTIETTGNVLWEVEEDVIFSIGDSISLRTTQEGFDAGNNFGVTLRLRRTD